MAHTYEAAAFCANSRQALTALALVNRTWDLQKEVGAHVYTITQNGVKCLVCISVNGWHDVHGGAANRSNVCTKIGFQRMGSLARIAY